MRGATLLRRSKLAASPLTLATWHTAFWASDPNWTPPADGAAVASWRDASSNGRTASQATGSKQPLYRASVAALNNRPALEFDGVDDFMQTAAFSAVAQPSEVIVIGRFRTLAAGSTFIANGIATGNRHQISANTTAWGMFAGTARTGGTPNTNAHFLRAMFTTTDLLDVDGSNVISADAGSHTLTGVTLGAAFDGASGWGPVDIAFYGFNHLPAIDTATRAALRAWAQAFYGTP